MFPNRTSPTSRGAVARWARGAAALLPLLLLAGCSLSDLWRMDGHQSTLHVAGPVAHAQREVFYVTVWVTLTIFVLVGGTLAYATWRFRATNAADEHVTPHQGHGNPLVELSLIGASIAALVIIAVPTLYAIRYTYDVAPEEKANVYEVNATGYQWWFRFEYPTEQATIEGTTKAPLATANELVIPAGRPVRINLRTTDVIHSFWVPKLAGKVDMIPNRANFLWLQADEPGYFWGQCAEYCGDSHAVMRFRVIALSEKEFAEWLKQETAPARNVEPTSVAVAPNTPKAQFASYRPPEDFQRNESGITDRFEVSALDGWRAQQMPEKNEDPELIAKGKTLFTAKTCVACHTIRGHGAQGVTGPDLTHFGARTTLAAGLLENNPEQVRRWLHNPGVVKPGNKMAKGFIDNGITLSADDEIALVAYLRSLK